jgi:site-specific recombinase XerD
VTLHGSIAKLRRTIALIAPHLDLSWLSDIEADLELTMQPRSKHPRLVLTETLLEAGLTLMIEANAAAHRSPLGRARQFRNGLMVALLACCPVRLKNFAALAIGGSFVQSADDWWIVLSATDTKGGRADERRVPGFLNSYVEAYLSQHRPILGRASELPSSLWLSSNDGTAMTYAGVEQVISATTQATLGVNVSPHLFRTSAATTAAMRGGATPHLASALLQHRDPLTTEAHYNRASSLSAAATFAEVVRTLHPSRHDAD